MLLPQTDPRDLRCYSQGTNSGKNVDISIHKIENDPLFMIGCFTRANGSII